MTSKILCSIAAMLALASIPACSSCNPTTEPRGSVSAAWSITVRSQPITCARVGGVSVSLLLHNRASGADVTSAFACTDAHGIESGAYAIHVGGLIGPSRCWVGDDALSVPTGASLVKAIELAPQQGAGC